MPTSTGKIYLGSTLVSGGGATPTDDWVRNPSWPACEANAGDNKIVGLYAVWPGDGVGAGGNFFAVSITGAYTIDYGDGTTTNYTSGSTAYYEYDYNDADLAGSDAPVTFTASTDTVNRTAHGYTNGMTVQFYNIATTTGLDEGQIYYVINASANTFQVSLTDGGSAVTLTNDGSATLLPYKIAVVTITPQAANDLTSVNFLIKHNETGLVSGYSSGWLDIAIAAPSCINLVIGGSSTSVRHMMLERVRINQLGNITDFGDLFYNIYNLRSVVIADTITTLTDTNSMFFGCYSIVSVPLFDTSSVTNMNYMFRDCRSLTSVPLFDTSSAQYMTGMFYLCYSITSFPAFDTSSALDVSSMFYGCNSITTIPAIDTSSAVIMSSMFNACESLVSIPLIDTSSATTVQSMFSGCNALRFVPPLNTSSATNMATMFYNCYALEAVPLLDTSLATRMESMFYNCYKLKSLPLLDTSSAQNMSGMFYRCYALESIPALTTTSVTSSTNFNNVFFNCYNLARIEAKDFNYTFSVASCKLSAAALDEIYTNLPTTTGQTITVSGNYGIAGDDPTIATAKGWTVTGS